jgi:hypothetical protein
MSKRIWRKAKPTALPNTRFPKDALGRRAKAAFEDWKQKLSPLERRKLSARSR